MVFANKTSKIDKVSLDKLFDRYFTVENAKKTSGIGLSIARELVLLLGGTIEAIYKDNILSIIVTFKE